MKSLSLSRPLTLPCVHDNTIAEQRAAIENLNSQLATLRNDLTTAQSTAQAAISERDSARADLVTARANLTTITSERDSARTDLATAQASLATAQAEVTRLTADRASVESRANRLLASRGFAPLDISGETDDAGNALGSGPSTAAEYQAAYRKITDHKARAKFYAENKDKMFPSAKSKKDK